MLNYRSKLISFTKVISHQKNGISWALKNEYYIKEREKRR
jgi:hypothetical protein